MIHFSFVVLQSKQYDKNGINSNGLGPKMCIGCAIKMPGLAKHKENVYNHPMVGV